MSFFGSPMYQVHCTCSWWWFLRNLTRLVARGGKSALIFKLLTIRPNLGSKLKFFRQVDPVGKISTFQRLEWWRSTWTSCSQCKSIFIVSKFDGLLEFVRSRRNWSASKTSRLFTWLIPSSFLKNGTWSLCTKKFLRQIWPGLKIIIFESKDHWLVDCLKPVVGWFWLKVG